MHLFGMKCVAGSSVVVPASSAAVALPLNATGERPRYLYVAATAPGTLRFGDSTVALAGVTDIHIVVEEPVVFDVTGFSHIRPDTAGAFIVTALENGGGQAAAAGTP